MNKQIDNFDVRKKDFYRNIVEAYRFSDLYDPKKGQKQNMLSDLTKQGFSGFDDHLNDLYWRKKIDMTFEYTKITIPNKRFLWSDEFKNWDDDKKSIALCNMISQWQEVFTKDEFMDLVKDWSPLLEAISWTSLFSTNFSIDSDRKRRAQADSFTIKDLDELKINEWPEKTRYDFISWPLRNEDCSTFSDLQAVEDLENSTTFREGSQDIKLFLIEKLLDNKNKSLGIKHLKSEELDSISRLAKNNLTSGYRNRLDIHTHKKYGLIIDGSRNDISTIFSLNCIHGTAMKFGTMKFGDFIKLDGYNELDGNSKLHFLLLCDEKDLKVENFDRLLPELDLNDYITREYALKAFFVKSGITADIIAQKNNWPIDVKTIAFKSLPEFQRTAKNFKIIFWPEEIKLMFDAPEIPNINRIKSRVKEYINILKPDFNLSNKNRNRMNALLKQVDNAKNKEDLRKLFDQMTIYKTMSELNADQIAEYINKIQELIGNDEQKAKAFLDYLFNYYNQNLPDFIANDSDLAGFVHYVKNAFDKSRDDFEFWMSVGANTFAVLRLGNLGFLAVILLAPELLIGLPTAVIPIAMLVPALTALFGFLGAGAIISRSRLKRNLAATKMKEFTKQLKNLKKEIDKVIEKNPKLKQQVKNITDKVKQQEDKVNALSEQEIALYNFIDENYKDADERKKNIKEILDLSQGSREDLAFELTTEVVLDVSLRDAQRSTEKEVYNFIDENYKEDADERKKNIKEILDNTNGENREIIAADILKQLVEDKSKQEEKENTVSQDAKITNQAEIANKNLDNDILHEEDTENENIDETNKNNDIENKNEDQKNNIDVVEHEPKDENKNISNKENKTIDDDVAIKVVENHNEQEKREEEKIFTNNIQKENKNMSVDDLNDPKKQEGKELLSETDKNMSAASPILKINNDQEKHEEEKLYTNNIKNESKSITLGNINDPKKQEGKELFTNNEANKETKININSSCEKNIKGDDQKNNKRKIKLSGIKEYEKNKSQDIDDDRKAILTKLKELKEKKNFGKKLGNDEIE